MSYRFPRTLRPRSRRLTGLSALLLALSTMTAVSTAGASIPGGGTPADDKKEEKIEPGFGLNAFAGAFSLSGTDVSVRLADGTPFAIHRTFSSDVVQYDDDILADRTGGGARWGGYRLSLSSPLLGGLWNLETGGRLVGAQNVLVAPRFALAKENGAYALKASLELRAQQRPLFVTGEGKSVSFTLEGAPDVERTEAEGIDFAAQGYQYVVYKRGTSTNPTWYVHERFTSPDGHELYLLSQLDFTESSLVPDEEGVYSEVIKPSTVKNHLAVVVAPSGHHHVLNYVSDYAPGETIDATATLPKILHYTRYPSGIVASSGSALAKSLAGADVSGDEAYSYARWSPDGLRVRHILSPRGQVLATVDFYNELVGSGGSDYWSKPKSVRFAGSANTVDFVYYHQSGNDSPSLTACQNGAVCDANVLMSMESQLLWKVVVTDADAVTLPAHGDRPHDAHGVEITYEYTLLGVTGNENGSYATSLSGGRKIYTDAEYIQTNHHSLGGVPFFPKGLSAVKVAFGQGNDDTSILPTVVESHAYGSFDYSAYASAQDWTETIDTCAANYPSSECGDKSLKTPYPIELAKQSHLYWRQYLLEKSWKLGRGATTYDYYDGVTNGAADSADLAYLPYALYPRMDHHHGDLGRRVYRLEASSSTSYPEITLPTNYVSAGMQTVSVAASAASGSYAGVAGGMFGLYQMTAYNYTSVPMTKYDAELKVIYDVYGSGDPEGGLSGVDMQKAYVYGTDLAIPFWESYYTNSYAKKRDYSWDEQYLGGKLGEQAVEDYLSANSSAPSLYEDIGVALRWSRRNVHGRWSYLVPKIAVKSISENGRTTTVAYNLNADTGAQLTPTYAASAMATTTARGEWTLVSQEPDTIPCGSPYNPSECPAVACTYQHSPSGEQLGFTAETVNGCSSALSAELGKDQFPIWYNSGASFVVSSSEAAKTSTLSPAMARKFTARVVDPDGVEKLESFSTLPTAYSFDEGLVHAAVADEPTFGKLLRTRVTVPGEESRTAEHEYRWGSAAASASDRLVSPNPEMLYETKVTERLFAKIGPSSGSGAISTTAAAITETYNFDRYGMPGTVKRSNGSDTTRARIEDTTFTHQRPDLYADHQKYNLLGLPLERKTFFLQSGTTKPVSLERVSYDVFGRPARIEADGVRTSGVPATIVRKKMAYHGGTTRTAYGHASLSASNPLCSYDGVHDAADDAAGRACWEADAYGSGTIFRGYRYGAPEIVHAGQDLSSVAGTASASVVVHPADDEPTITIRDYTGRVVEEVDAHGGVTHRGYRTFDGRVSYVDRPDPERDSVFEYHDPAANGVDVLASGNCLMSPAATGSTTEARVVELFTQLPAGEECTATAHSYEYTRRGLGSTPFTSVARGFGATETSTRTSEEYTSLTPGGRVATVDRHAGLLKIEVRTDTYRLTGRISKREEMIGGVWGTTLFDTEVANGQLTERVTDRAGVVNERTARLLGVDGEPQLLSAVEDAQGAPITRTYTHDTYGTLSSIGVNGLGSVRVYSYDAFNRMVWLYSYDKGYRATSYHDNGLIRAQSEGSTSADNDTFHRRNEYDRAGRLVRVFPKAGAVALREMTYENGLLTGTVSRRAEGHAATVIDGSAAVVSEISYLDPARRSGEVVRVVDADGDTVGEIARTYTYGNAATPAFKTAETAAITVGDVTTPWYSRTFTPTSDGRERLYRVDHTTSVAAETGSVRYITYRTTGEATSQQMYSGASGISIYAKRSYTADGQVSRVYDGASTYVDRSYAYDARGFVSQVTGTLNGQSYLQDYAYDARGQLAEENLDLAESAATGALDQIFTTRMYEHNALGKRTRRYGLYDASSPETAGEDGTSKMFEDVYGFQSSEGRKRLDAVQITNAPAEALGTISYAYTTGNYVTGILRDTGAGTSQSLVQSVALVYDPLGQVVAEQVSHAITSSDVTETFHDAEGRPTYVVSPDGTHWLYAYEGLRRTHAVELSSGKRRAMIYTPMGLSAVATNEAGEGFEAVINDRLGSSLFSMTSPSAAGGRRFAVLDAFGNSAYGKHFTDTEYDPATESGAEVSPMFTEKHRGNGTGLYHFHARHLDPVTGQFVQPDPVEHLGFFAYALNNPVALIDPDGREEGAPAAPTAQPLVSTDGDLKLWEFKPPVVGGIVHVEGHVSTKSGEGAIEVHVTAPGGISGKVNVAVPADIQGAAAAGAAGRGLVNLGVKLGGERMLASPLASQGLQSALAGRAIGARLIPAGQVVQAGAAGYALGAAVRELGEWSADGLTVADGLVAACQAAGGCVYW